MVELSEPKAVAIMMANLKGSKNKPSDLLEFAEACRVLRNKWGFNTMAKEFGTSEFMLRQIDKINDLTDPQIRRWIKEGKIKIEAAYHIWRLDENIRLEAAKIIKDMQSDDVRAFTQILLKQKGISVEEARQLLEKSKPVKIKLLVLPVNPELFEKLQKLSAEQKIGVHDYVLKVIEEKVNE